MNEPVSWRVTAINLPEHARNPIHTDEGARAAGFPRALVAGVTTYAYMTHPLAAAWGHDWLGSGGGEVRFRSPVFQSDDVLCEASHDGETWVVSARVGDGKARAELRGVRDAGLVPEPRGGESLQPLVIELVGQYGTEYGSRAGDDLTIYRAEGIVHPAVWPALANAVVHAQLARGSWIHTRSVVRHHAIVAAGSTATVHAVVVDRFHRSGERAVIDVRIEVGGQIVATLEHEAIIALPPG